MNITGHTKFLGLLGYPVHHTASPAMHNAGFAAVGLDWVYLAFEVPPGRVVPAVRGLRELGFQGGNVTIPHKRALMKLVDDLTPEARLIGAVNTLFWRNSTLVGHNTDGEGFLEALRKEFDMDLKGRRLFLAGAGGAGSAVGVQAAIAGLKELVVSDIVPDRLSALSRRVRRAGGCAVRPLPAGSGDIPGALAGVDLFVDATGLGLDPSNPTCVDVGVLKEEVAVMDLVYSPAETRLMKEARAAGCRVSNGLGMLLGQGTRAFECWTGRPAPTEVMECALKKAVFGEDPA